MNKKIKLGISSCLLGEKVRYDGTHKLDHYLTDTLGKYVQWVPVCPEVESGLPVPREAMRLVEDPDSPRLVTRKSGIDHTSRMLKWTGEKLKQLKKEKLCGFIFKSRSPSSGIRNVKVYTPQGMPARNGKGIFGGAFTERFPYLPAEDDGRLHNPALRENFIERVFVYKRWQELLDSGLRPGRLVNFHTSHKLMVMAHSQKLYNLLGRVVAEIKKQNLQETQDRYTALLMEALKLTATVKKNTNVLMHIQGHFKKQLSSDEKKELLEVIGHYHKGLVPLIVPVVLINHYVRKYNEAYLKKQYYLNPSPLELMLRNHV